MDIPTELKETAARQCGVVARRQLTASGLADHHVRRLVRWRLLVPVAHGVYATHTGQLSWEQRAWIEVLRCWPAVLDGPSALRSAGMKVDLPDRVVHVAVDATRTAQAGAGVTVRRVRDLDRVALWQAGPPRMRVEPALLHVAAHAPDDLRAVGWLTDAVGDRITTPDRLRAELASRRRIARRDVITDIVEGLADGANSVLEQAYLRRVEQAHGLPRGTRQARLRGERWHRDVLHEEEKVVVELDGRAYHSRSRARFGDLERDASAAAAGFLSLRLGWEQVVGAPCSTARRVGSVLLERGWSGPLRSCTGCGDFAA